MDELKNQRQKIRSLMQYAAPEEQLNAALDLLLVFRNDRIALTVLHEFYSYLPDPKTTGSRNCAWWDASREFFLLLR